MLPSQMEITAWEYQHVQSDEILHYSSLSSDPATNSYHKSHHPSGVKKFRLNKGSMLSKSKPTNKPAYNSNILQEKNLSQAHSPWVEQSPLNHKKCKAIIKNLPALTSHNQIRLKQKRRDVQSGSIVNLYDKFRDKIKGDSQKQNNAAQLKKHRGKISSKRLQPKIISTAKKQAIQAESVQPPRVTHRQFQFFSHPPLNPSQHQQESQYLQSRRKQLSKYLQRKKSHQGASKHKNENKQVSALEQTFENRNRVIVRNLGESVRPLRMCSLQIKKYSSCWLGD